MNLHGIESRWLDSARNDGWDKYSELEVALLAGLIRGFSNVDQLTRTLHSFSTRLKQFSNAIDRELMRYPEDGQESLRGDVDSFRRAGEFVEALDGGVREILNIAKST